MRRDDFILVGGFLELAKVLRELMLSMDLDGRQVALLGRLDSLMVSLGYRPGDSVRECDWNGQVED